VLGLSRRGGFRTTENIRTACLLSANRTTLPVRARSCIGRRPSNHAGSLNRVVTAQVDVNPEVRDHGTL